MVGVASDEEKNPFSVQVKRWPDRDTMTPIKEPCRVGTLSTPGIIFLGKGWTHPEGSRDGPALRSRNRLAFSRPRPYARVPVLLGCPDLTWPARCSRDTAMVAVFRLASSHPQPETDPRRVIATYCPPFQGREERSGRWVVAAVARVSAASGCEGNEPHQR